MRIHHWVIVVLWLSSVFYSESRAQQLKASASAQEVAPGEVFQWEIVLEGSSGELLPIPNVKPFIVVSGPSGFYNLQFINGRKKVVESWQFTLKAPPTPGTYQLPSASVKADGKNMLSNGVSVTVSKATSTKNTSPTAVVDQPVQVIWQVGSNESCVGCQVLLEAYIITGVDIATLELLQAPASAGGYLRELNVAAGSPEVLQVKGKRYLRQLIYRAAFYPQKAGEIRIQPIRVQALIHETSEEERDPFSWFRPSVIPLEVESETLVLKVQDPFSLSDSLLLNGSGDFSASTLGWPDEVFVGEAFTWKVHLHGYGDPNMVHKPEPAYGTGLTYFPDMADDLTSGETAKGLLHRISWSYVFVPKDTGDQIISLPFHYFDQETGKVKKLELIDTVYVKPASLPAGGPTGPDTASSSEVHSGMRDKMPVKMMLALILLFAALAATYYLVRLRFRHKTATAPSMSPSCQTLFMRPVVMKESDIEQMARQKSEDVFFKTLRQDMLDTLNYAAGASLASATDDDALQFLHNQQWTKEEIHDWVSLFNKASAFLYGMNTGGVSASICWSRYKQLRQKLIRV
jgi:hypothetical protein